MPYLIHVYLQLGVVGVLLFMVFLISLFIRHPEGYSRRDLNLQLFLILLIGINFFYIESLRDPVFCIAVYGMIACSWFPDQQVAEEAEEQDAPGELAPAEALHA